jgi:hypothetical protein
LYSLLGCMYWKSTSGHYREETSESSHSCNFGYGIYFSHEFQSHSIPSVHPVLQVQSSMNLLHTFLERNVNFFSKKFIYGWCPHEARIWKAYYRVGYLEILTVT